jgi:hypothetical protein
MGLIRGYVDSKFDNDETESVGIGGFRTFAKIRERVLRTRDIPTTYLENGMPTNDHIIRNPLSLSIEGNVSDIFIEGSRSIELVRAAEESIGTITQYLPSRTQAQLSRLSGLVNDVNSAVNLANSVINSTQRIASILTSSGKSNIEAFIDAMEALDSSDALITIDAPFRSYKNMVMTSLDYDRDNTTDSLNFSIEFTQFRFTETVFTKSAKKPSSANNGQQSDEADKGVQNGEETGQSFLSYLFGGD